MITQPKPPANPWDDPHYNPNPVPGAIDAGGGTMPAPGNGSPGSPSLNVSSIRKISTPPSTLNAAPGAPPRGAPAPGGTTATGEPPAPTVLPDGAGGSVPVPPASIAPGAGAAAGGTPAPWEATTFDQGHNLIGSQITPTGLPDRNKMALDQYNTFEQETAPGFEHSITDATDAAAAHGQIRSGQLTNRYGDLARQRVLDQTTARNKYMQGALDSSIGDATQARAEGRTERDYQRSLAEQAIARRIQQQQAESGQALTQFQAGNAMPDATGAIGDAAQLSGAEAQQSSSDMAAVIRAWLARQQQPAVAA